MHLEVGVFRPQGTQLQAFETGYDAHRVDIHSSTKVTAVPRSSRMYKQSFVAVARRIEENRKTASDAETFEYD